MRLLIVHDLLLRVDELIRSFSCVTLIIRLLKLLILILLLIGLVICGTTFSFFSLAVEDQGRRAMELWRHFYQVPRMISAYILEGLSLLARACFILSTEAKRGII